MPFVVQHTTWKVSAPEGGANLHFFVSERKKGYFESLAEQGFQNIALVISVRTKLRARAKRALSILSVLTILAIAITFQVVSTNDFACWKVCTYTILDFRLPISD